MATPNLFSARPVVIFAWVRASTSGFTRSATRAVRPREVASAEIIPISSALSALIWRMSSARARRSSRSVLPTPEKTMRAAGMPAARAMRSSPSLTTSAPEALAGGGGPARRGCRSPSSRNAPRRRARHRPARRSARGRGGAGCRRNRPRQGVPTAWAMRSSGTPSTSSPSRACMARCGRAAMSSPKLGSGSSCAGRGEGAAIAS